MRYVTGIHALNLPCSLQTCGDWHKTSLDWSEPRMQESEGSLWGDYGIETNVEIPCHAGHFNVADHIRALLDMLEKGEYGLAQGMRDDFICNDAYTPEIFEKVSMMRNLAGWEETDKFMGEEYFCQWLEYKKAQGMPMAEKKRPPADCLALMDEEAIKRKIKETGLEQMILYACWEAVQRKDLRSLYEFCTLLNRFIGGISEEGRFDMGNAMSYYLYERVRYMICTQEDGLVDTGKLVREFRRMQENLRISDDTWYAGEDKKMLCFAQASDKQVKRY